MIEGTIVLIPANTVHQTTYIGSESCERLNIEFSADYITNLQKLYGKAWTEINLFQNFIYINPIYKNSVHSQLEELINETNTKDMFTDYLIKIHFHALLLHLIRIKEERCVLNINKTVIVDQSMKRALQYINDNFYKKITLKDLAKMLGLNSSYFSNKFKSVNGVGFKEYLNMVRISHADRLLIETNLDITNIALQSGFESSNYFSDAFKKVHNISPSQFRKLKGNIT